MSVSYDVCGVVEVLINSRVRNPVQKACFVVCVGSARGLGNLSQGASEDKGGSKNERREMHLLSLCPYADMCYVVFGVRNVQVR
jgi:hypothetical protein